MTREVECPHKDRKHYANGLCRSCYKMEKYWRDEKYREKEKKRMRKASTKWAKRKCKENPKWNAKRQKKFRKEHPDSFNYIMARFYMRKLSKEKITELLQEIGYGKENNT